MSARPCANCGEPRPLVATFDDDHGPRGYCAPCWDPFEDAIA